ncbi:MAG TPA: replication-relaxation family protein [Actinomycetota bacterium]|nr:replication-relaxation family protein [Actinomycetota bacterium]
MALDQLSSADREIVAVLSEHRVATTQQISTLLKLPERTARYRLDRLWKLGLCGGRQPYADQGSAPYHWWPSRLADAFHRGNELPRGGEREDPQEQFLRHAAAITGLYVALVRLAPSLGWELLAFAREVEAREEFQIGERQAAIVPDAFVLLRDGEAEYHGMVEIDRGTMSIPRLSKKLSLYLAWAASGVWQERHPYLPALLVLTTTPRRVEKVAAKAEERCRTEARTAPTHSGFVRIHNFVVAATDAVDRPETAVADPVWRNRGGVECLQLADLLREPWQRWRTEVTEKAAEVGEARRKREAFLGDAEGLRRSVQALNRRWYGISTYNDHLQDLEEGDRDAMELLLNETSPMTDLDKRVWRFFARRTVLDEQGRPTDAQEKLPMTPEDREAIASLREGILVRQREFVASLHARYPYLPWVLRAIRELDGGKLLYHRTWWERHERTRKDLAELKRLQGRAKDYLGWRSHEVSTRRWGANVIERLGPRSDRRLARAIDEERLRACPNCEQLVVPSREDLRYQVGYCAFCGSRDKLLSISDAQAAGLVEPDGERFWRTRHGPVPGWAEGQPLPQLDDDGEESP